MAPHPVLIVPVVPANMVPCVSLCALVIEPGKPCCVRTDFVMEASVIEFRLASREDDSRINEVLLLLITEILVPGSVPAALALAVWDKHIQLVTELVVRALTTAIASGRVYPTGVIEAILLLSVMHDTN